MKHIASLSLITVILFGSYHLGKIVADDWWKREVIDRANIEALRLSEIDHNLYDWKRSIRTAIYIGCGAKNVELKDNSITLEDVDYGIWLNGCNAPITVKGNHIKGTMVECVDPSENWIGSVNQPLPPTCPEKKP